MFKVVVLFYFCVFLMFMVAGVLLWRIGRSTETIDQFEGLVTRLGAYGQCVPEAEVEPGTDFETDEDCPEGEVIIDGFKFNDGTLFRAALFAGGIFVVAGTAITVLLTILLNLLNDVTGGVRYVTIREPTPESGASPPDGRDGTGRARRGRRQRPMVPEPFEARPGLSFPPPQGEPARVSRSIGP